LNLSNNTWLNFDDFWSKLTVALHNGIFLNRGDENTIILATHEKGSVVTVYDKAANPMVSLYDHESGNGLSVFDKAGRIIWEAP
jgi:hypothetical protein